MPKEEYCPFTAKPEVRVRCGDWCSLFNLEQKRCEFSLLRKEVAKLVVALKGIERLLKEVK